ncbi:MAG: hypothetical protein RLY86_3427 [Pseudomonadota bacterium]|jgi:RimJ/RimL family protein N-acetyltransferase
MLLVPEALQTDRLTATRLTEADRHLIAAMHQDADAMVRIGGLRDEAGTERYMAFNLRHWAEKGFGVYMLRDRARGEFLGRAGLRHRPPAEGEGVEIVYALLPVAQGRGLGPEFLVCLLGLARGPLGLSSVMAMIEPENTPSLRVAERAGFQVTGEVVRTGRRHLELTLAFPAPGDTACNP